jgi:hypothetical protein
MTVCSNVRVANIRKMSLSPKNRNWCSAAEMSALGQKQTFCYATAMSALPQMRTVADGIRTCASSQKLMQLQPTGSR